MTSGRLAAIDIGTNSVLLVVAEPGGGGELLPVLERATITRLGEGVDRTRRLAPQAVERTLACLEAYAEEIRREGVGALDVVGTSAMRDAGGGAEFARRAAVILGAPPRVISGGEEAALTFAGGLSGLGLPALDVAVFDIGGGSTEIVRGRTAPPLVGASVSLDVGGVRLTERHLHSDPPSPGELARLDDDIARTLASSPVPLAGASALVGVAGTVTTLAAIARSVDPYDPARVHGARLERAEVERLAASLAAAPLAERKRLRGLAPERADVIVAGARLCAAILAAAGVGELIVSDRGVRWGLLEALRARGAAGEEI